MQTVIHGKERSIVQKIKARDEEGPFSFEGELIADMTWSYAAAKERGHQRWTDLRLYRVAQEGVPYKYGLQVVGRSIVYHRAGGPCHRGVRMAVGVLALSYDTERYDALEACEACQPYDLDDDRLANTDTIAVEEDFPKFHRCHNADEVIDALKDHLRGPATRLLQAACRIDADFFEAMASRRGI